ncbi:retinol dehydrogenase 13-like [Argonauta hians]
MPLLYLILGLIMLPVLYYVQKLYSFIRTQTCTLRYTSDKRLDGKTVLITGANASIGYATALDFAGRGARVLLACRNLNKAVEAVKKIIKETGNDNLRTIQLDLSDLESVRRLVRQVLRNEDRLDILVNNAGTGISDIALSKQGFDYIFGVNYVGSFLLTHLLTGLLKKSAPSRIINVSSLSHHCIKDRPSLDRGNGEMKYPGLKKYPMSKLCNILHTKALTNYLYDTRVTANSMNPGIVNTNILNQSKTGILYYMLYWFLKLFGRTSKDAAKTIVYMALDDGLQEVSGHYFENVNISSDKLSQLTKDKEFIFDLWDASLKMCEE